MTDQINDKPTLNELIKRFAMVNNITEEEAKNLIGAEDEETILKKIEEYTTNKIKEKLPHLNRAQRRALAKKKNKNKKNLNSAEMTTVMDAAKKINYINLIQKLRELNEKNKMEIKENEEINKNN